MLLAPFYNGNSWAKTIGIGSLLISTLLIFPAWSQAKPLAITPSKRKDLTFHQHIKPLLSKSCVACHSASDHEDSGLIVETVAGLKKGGYSGPAILPGKGRDSLLVKLSAHQQMPVMPPANDKRSGPNFTPAQLGLIVQWIDLGAPEGKPDRSDQIAWRSMPERWQPTHAVAMSPDGVYLAAGHANQLDVYHAPSGILIARLHDPALKKTLEKAGTQIAGPPPAHLDVVQSLAFSPDGQWLASGGYRCAKLWKRQAPTPKQKVEFKNSIVASAVSAEGKYALLAARDGTLHLWNLQTGKKSQIKVDDKPALVVALAESAPWLALVTAQDKNKSKIQLLLSKNNTVVSEWTVDANITSAVISSQPSALWLGTRKGEIQAWPIDGYLLEVLSGKKPIPTDDANKKLLQLPKMHPPLKAHQSAITSLAVARQQPFLVSGSLDKTIRLWETRTRRLEKTHGMDAVVNDVGISDDAKVVVGIAGPWFKRFDRPGKLLNQFRGTPKARFEWKMAEREKVVAIRRRSVTERLLNSMKNLVKKSQEEVKKATDEKKKADQALAQATKEANERETEWKKSQADYDKTMTEKTKAEADRKVLVEQINKAKDDEKKKRQQELQKLDQRRQQLNKQENVQKRTLDDRKKKHDEAQRKRTDAAKQAKQRADDILLTNRQLTDHQNRQTQLSKELQQQSAQVTSTESASKRAEQDWKNSGKTFQKLALSHDGKQAWVADDQGRWLSMGPTFDSPTAVVRQGPAGSNTLIGAAGAQGRQLLAVSEKSASLWPGFSTWTCVKTLGVDDEKHRPAGRVRSVAFDPAGKTLAVGGGEASRFGQIQLWDLPSFQWRRDLSDPHSDSVTSMEFSPDGGKLVSGSADKLAKVFEVSTGKVLARLEGHDHHVLGVGWSGEGHEIASAGADQTVRIWNWAQQKSVRTIGGLGPAVSAVRYFPTDSVAFIVTEAGSVRLVESNTGRTRRMYHGAVHQGQCLATDAMGRWVVVGDQTGRVLRWDTAGHLLNEILPPGN